MGITVSIVIPVYNVEKYLQDCLNSVIDQTYRDLEIILVDDGSTDKSGIICDEYASTDNRFFVIHKENGGASSARNVGLKHAKGDYVFFLDDDDYLEKTAIEKMAEAAQKSHADIVMIDGVQFDDGANINESADKYAHIKHYCVPTGRALLLEQFNNNDYYVLVELYLFKKEYLNRMIFSFYEGIIHEDELFVFYALYYANSVIHVREKLIHRRKRPNSVMTSSSIERRFNSMVVIFSEMNSHFSQKELDYVICKRLSDMAKSVYYLFVSLSPDLKEKYSGEYKSIKRIVISRNGYGNLKLLEKYSSGLIKLYYRIKRKAIKGKD